MNLILNN